MNKEFYFGNRQKLYTMLQPGSLMVLFSGNELRKSADAYYLFYANRNFVYLTGISQKESVLLVQKHRDGSVKECLYLLPKDAMAERWTGRRLNGEEAEALSGIGDVRSKESFDSQFHTMALSGSFDRVYLDLHRQAAEDAGREAHSFAQKMQTGYPHLTIANMNPYVRKLRTIKQPCEIAALRKAEEITKAGILAMMRASRPGMWEYQYKAEFDRALGQFGPEGPGFPSIISAGQNNFCIHYYSYTGQAHDGDMILNDVGAQHDWMITDVSRGWPCNGRFTEKQKLLYECALATSDYMFSIIKPGMPMADVDATIKRYNFERLKDAGVLRSFDEIGNLMWHGGSHHIGYDVHDGGTAGIPGPRYGLLRGRGYLS